jgi:hypothetical protein
MKRKLTFLGLALVAAVSALQAQSAHQRSGNVVAVTLDNFNRAESDSVFASIVNDGGLGKFVHNSVPMLKDFPISRPNWDTLYSRAVFDLDAGPATITLPDAGKRFMSMQVIDEEQYTPAVYYGAGSHTLKREQIDTRYVSVGVRILVDPLNLKDIQQAHALQAAIAVSQKSSGTFETPNWDSATQKNIRDALLALGQTIPDTKGMFGLKNRVDPVRHLIGTAMGFGGNPERDALYLNVNPTLDDGSTIYRLTVKDVPVDGFWSISVYDSEGHFRKNELNAYTQNSITAKKAADGSVAIQFGGCNRVIRNCLPTMPGWNYLVRLYRPRTEILDGTWNFPEAQPVR